ncbi:hypothetical protein H4S07_002038 [Coemansia furcata]|uniref:Uncharacterized protein n=1 Tax=Coemansia furcata TaxID=417177 RepID=A0ACC1LKR5_9FUNG|nr:hypothetical protein H4S07_002038 [Coemansia furcata]
MRPPVRPTVPALPSTVIVPEALSQPDANATVKLSMYDFPLTRPIIHLRRVFVVNMVFSTSFSLWVGTDDIFTVFAAGMIMLGGFIPIALAHLAYRDHVRSIQILGGLSQKVLARAKKAELAGESQIEYPVTNNTPLLIKRFSVSARDPEVPLYVRDLVPGPSRRLSVLWLYKSASGMVKFRVSKKAVKHHPDIRALDERIRKNAQSLANAQAKQAVKEDRQVQ